MAGAAAILLDVWGSGFFRVSASLRPLRRPVAESLGNGEAGRPMQILTRFAFPFSIVPILPPPPSKLSFLCAESLG